MEQPSFRVGAIFSGGGDPRSRKISRSNSAKSATRPPIAWPVGVVTSSVSVSVTEFAPSLPDFLNSITMSRAIAQAVETRVS